jgi:hypothetical protein
MAAVGELPRRTALCLMRPAKASGPASAETSASAAAQQRRSSNAVIFMRFLRTSDHCFSALPDFAHALEYGAISVGETGSLRTTYVTSGPPTGPAALPLRGEPTWSSLHRCDSRTDVRGLPCDRAGPRGFRPFGQTRRTVRRPWAPRTCATSPRGRRTASPTSSCRTLASSDRVRSALRAPPTPATPRGRGSRE